MGLTEFFQRKHLSAAANNIVICMREVRQKKKKHELKDTKKHHGAKRNCRVSSHMYVIIVNIKILIVLTLNQPLSS